MKRFVFHVVILSVLLSLFSFIPSVNAASYSMPVAWQIVYLNPDGSLDVYDYREYHFYNGSPPTSTFPYELNPDYKIFNRTLKYYDFQAYEVTELLDVVLENPVDIVSQWGKISKFLNELPVSSSGYHYSVSVPDKSPLRLLIHYKVSPEITVVGKDFAMTYYQLVSMGKSPVKVKTYVTAFVLPRKADCNNNTNNKIEPNSSCPCFRVHKFVVKSPTGNPKEVIGNFTKTCKYVTFTAHNVDVRSVNELYAVYDLSLVPKYSLQKLDIDYETMNKRMEGLFSHSPILLVGLIITGSIIVFFVSALLFAVFYFILSTMEQKYLKKKIDEIHPKMKIPDKNKIKTAIMYNRKIAEKALSIGDPYVVVDNYNDVANKYIKDSEFRETLRNLLKSVFFSLMKKGYIEPIDTGDEEIYGYRINLHKDESDLDDAEKYVFKEIRRAAKDFSVSSSNETIKKLDLENDQEILTIEELEEFLKEAVATGTVNYHGVVEHYEISRLIAFAYEIYNRTYREAEIPFPLIVGKTPPDYPVIRFSIFKFISALSLTLFISSIFTLIYYLLFGNKIIDSVLRTGNWMLVYRPAAIITVIILLFVGLVYGFTHKRWFDKSWWERFTKWYAVGRWIEELTNITSDELMDIWEALNWDDYFELAILFGLERNVLNLFEKLPASVWQEKVVDSYIVTSFYRDRYYRRHIHDRYSGGIINPLEGIDMKIKDVFNQTVTSYENALESAKTYWEATHSSSRGRRGGFGGWSGGSFGGGFGGGGGSSGW